MKSILQEWCFSLYNIHNKNIPESERDEFDFKSVPNVDDNLINIICYALSPPFAIDLYNECHKFSCSDFTHGRHRTFAGILGSRYALNSNRSLVDLVHVRLLFNESRRS